MSKTVAVIQSNYIPWKGYFDLINIADELILYDDVQYTRRDWRNRNRIKTPGGTQWLTIPAVTKGRHDQAIKDTRIAEPEWGKGHWEAIRRNYARAACFPAHRELFEELYLAPCEEYLSEVNRRFIEAICDLLGIHSTLRWSMDYELVGEKTERLVSLCKQAGATTYLTGPSAKSYLEEDLFRQEGIAVIYMDYAGYPEYQQLFPPFEHAVSIVDLVLNEGTNATTFMKSF